MSNEAYRPPELFPRKSSTRRGEGPVLNGVRWLPLLPVAALVAAGMIYWLATTTDTNKIFGPSIAEH